MSRKCTIAEAKSRFLSKLGLKESAYEEWNYYDSALNKIHAMPKTYPEINELLRKKL